MAEQILIEFIGDATQLQPAVDILEKLGQIDSKAADSFRKSNTELSKRADTLKKVSTEENKHIKTLKDVENAVVSLGDTYTQVFQETLIDALTDAGVSAEDLDKKLLNLNNRAKDSGKSILEIVDAHEKLKKSLSENQSLSPYQKLEREVTLLNGKILDTATTIEHLKKTGAIDLPLFARLSEEIELDKIALTKLNAELEAIHKLSSIEIAPATQSKAEIEALNQQLIAMNNELARVDQLKNKIKESLATGPYDKLKTSIEAVNKRLLDSATRVEQLKKTGGSDLPLFKNLNEQIENDRKELIKLTKELETVKGIASIDIAPPPESEVKLESLKKQLGDIRTELLKMEVAGKSNTAEYQALLDKAGELKNAINNVGAAVSNAGSDTSGMDNLISLAGGVAGGFAVAQGAAALFGGESEEVQQVLLKVNSAMAILQGLQQIQDLMSKRQFQSMTALVGIQKVQVVQTQLSTAAESSNVVVRWLAVAAQKALNVVMAASPLGLTLVLVAAVAGAFALFSSKAEKATESLKRNNAALEEFGKKSDQLLSTIAAEGDKNVKQLQSQLASTNQVRQAQIASLNEQKAQAEESRRQASENSSRAYALYGQKKKLTEAESTEYQKAMDLKASADSKYFDIAHKIRDLQFEGNKQAYEDDIKSYVAFQEAKVFQARKGSIAELEAQINAVKARKDAELKTNPDATAGERVKIEEDANRQIMELDNQITIKRLENQKYLMEAKLATIKEGTVEELEEMKLISAKSLQIELATLGISSQKKKALTAQNQKEQEEFDRQIAQRKLEIELNGINAQLALVQEGSAKEFNLKLDAALKQKEIDLQQKGVTDDKRLLIEAEYLKKVRDLTKQYTLQTQQEALGIQQSNTNSKLAELQRADVAANNAELVQLKKDSIDEQAALDALNAKATINNAQVLAAKLLDIKAKSNAEKHSLDEAALTQTLDEESKHNETLLSLEAKNINLQLAQGQGNILQRGAMRKRLVQIEKESIDEEVRLNEEKYSKGLITVKDYEQKKLDLQGEYIDLEIEQEQQKQERKQEIIQAGFEVLTELSNAYFEAQSEKRQAELDQALASLDTQKQKELDNKNLTEQQKSDIDKKYKAKEAVVKRKAFEDDKRAKKSQAIINGLLGVTNALATAPNIIAGIILAAVVAATTAIQVAKINSTPVPQFKRGTKFAPRGYAWVGEEGAELVQLSGGEKIYTYGQSKKIENSWSDGLSRTPDEILSGTLPSNQSDFISNSYVHADGSMSLDYDRLGRAFARHVPRPAIIQNNMDKNGFTTYVLEEGSKNQIKNQRYTFS